MDGDGIGQLQLVEFIELVDHLARSETDQHLLLFPIHGSDPADVAVEDLLVVVVGGLDDLITYPEEIAVGLVFIAILAFRIQRGLEAEIEFLDAEASPVHWAQDLDPLDRIDTEMLGQAVTHHGDQGRGAFLGILAVDEDKVRILWCLDDIRNLTAVDGMGPADDATVPSLPEDLLEVNHRNHSAADDVSQDEPRTDAR